MERLYRQDCYAHTQLQGQQEAGKSNLIVVVLSFNAFPRYVQIEVDSLPAVSGW